MYTASNSIQAHNICNLSLIEPTELGIIHNVIIAVILVNI
jgi:hypothetical protein